MLCVPAAAAAAAVAAGATTHSLPCLHQSVNYLCFAFLLLLLQQVPLPTANLVFINNKCFMFFIEPAVQLLLLDPVSNVDVP
jgi:hypothetical protein